MSIADKQSFRDAMAHVGAAVNIITTDGPAGRAGFTASAVCSVTDAPPTLLVCLNRSASVWPIFSQHRALCVNTTAAGGKNSRTFSAVKRRWRSASPPPTGKPARPAARVWKRRWSASTAVSARSSASGLTIFFCEVAAIVRHPEPRGLMWFDRGYHTLMRPAC